MQQHSAFARAIVCQQHAIHAVMMEMTHAFLPLLEGDGDAIPYLQVMVLRHYINENLLLQPRR